MEDLKEWIKETQNAEQELAVSSHNLRVLTQHIKNIEDDEFRNTLKKRIIEVLTFVIMEVIGVDLEEKGLQDTPRRIAKMYIDEIFKNVNNRNENELIEDMTMFPIDKGTSVISIEDIKFSSFCEHHFLPFFGTVDIQYTPSDRVLGLSKFPKVVEFFSRKPQIQERFTDEVGKFLVETLSPKDLYVTVRAHHTCVSCRGAKSDIETCTHYEYINRDIK